MGIDYIELLFPPPRTEDEMRRGPDTDDDGDTDWENFGDGDGGPTD